MIDLQYANSTGKFPIDLDLDMVVKKQYKKI